MRTKLKDRPLVGIVIPAADNSFFSNLADSAARCLSALGYNALILSSLNSAEQEKEHLKTLTEIGAKGILCVSGLSALPEDLLPAGFPLVWLDRYPASDREIPLVANDDRAAFGVITALHRVGLYVPEDVKLISFDNSPYSSMASPAITALDRNPRLLAETACRTLLDLMEGRQVEKETIIPVSLCKRDSTR